MKYAAFSTSVPVEILFAAGYSPLDLNNVFITAPAPSKFVADAEYRGFPKNYCAWLKGGYGVLNSMEISLFVSVGEGECSGAVKMADLLRKEGVRVVDFDYGGNLKKRFADFASLLGADLSESESVFSRLSSVREKLMFIDRLSYSDMKVRGAENFNWLISASDFKSDYVEYEGALDKFTDEIKCRPEGLFSGRLRIALIGIPPIVNGIFELVEELGGIIVYNEMPHQFALPYFRDGFIESYEKFTYPAPLDVRVAEIEKNLRERNIDGVISYTQSFCPRQLDEVVLREKIQFPFLTIESDRPGYIDERNRIRIEAFFERLK